VIDGAPIVMSLSAGDRAMDARCVWRGVACSCMDGFFSIPARVDATANALSVHV